jgi:hypothetical protein
LCPACRQERTGQPRGYVHLAGAFLREHLYDIERLLQNEVDRVLDDNPLARISTWGDDGAGGLLIATTTEHLAQRLGHAVQKAFDGELRYGFSHENKQAHVWWQR